MRITIMQPYLFPYLGYFQLLACSDIFVAYDDAQYMKGGWVNRNQLLIQGNPHLFTLSVDRAPLKTSIVESTYSKNLGPELARLDRTLVQNYSKAPFFGPVMELFRESLMEAEHNVASFNIRGILRVSEYLELSGQVLRSSDICYDRTGSATDKVIAICRELGGTHYINSIGGQQLYDTDHFLNHGIELSFLKSESVPYHQGRAPFVPNLSILDVLMFNAPEVVRGMLNQYTLSP